MSINSCSPIIKEVQKNLDIEGTRVELKGSGIFIKKGLLFVPDKIEKTLTNSEIKKVPQRFS